MLWRWWMGSTGARGPATTGRGQLTLLGADARSVTTTTPVVRQGSAADVQFSGLPGDRVALLVSTERQRVPLFSSLMGVLYIGTPAAVAVTGVLNDSGTANFDFAIPAGILGPSSGTTLYGQGLFASHQGAAFLGGPCAWTIVHESMPAN